MTFFEKELRKVIEPLKLGAVYVGGKTAYIPLGDVKIRVDFHHSFSVGNYDELLVKVINKRDGDVDVITIKFRDVWGKRTCFWIKGLPTLKATKIVEEHYPWMPTAKHPGGSKRNSRSRSKTFHGVALAMAEQWG